VALLRQVAAAVAAVAAAAEAFSITQPKSPAAR
jgi:hypothetical protein